MPDTGKIVDMWTLLFLCCWKTEICFLICHKANIYTSTPNREDKLINEEHEKPS